MRNLKQILPLITAQQLQQLQTYADLLEDWNLRINLISRRDITALWENHLLPSLAVLPSLDIPLNSRVIDIGSGGGLPAIPLKIMRPDISLLMVDSILKKTIFLKHVTDRLQLSEAAALNQRVEGLLPEHAGQFDLVTARAVAPVAQLLDWGEPLLKQNGRWILWKGESDMDDLQQALKDYGKTAQVVTVPPELHPLSAKFEALRFFVIRKKPI